MSVTCWKILSLAVVYRVVLSTQSYSFYSLAHIPLKFREYFPCKRSIFSHLGSNSSRRLLGKERIKFQTSDNLQAVQFWRPSRELPPYNKGFWVNLVSDKGGESRYMLLSPSEISHLPSYGIRSFWSFLFRRGPKCLPLRSFPKWWKWTGNSLVWRVLPHNMVRFLRNFNVGSVELLVEH